MATIQKARLTGTWFKQIARWLARPRMIALALISVAAALVICESDLRRSRTSQAGIVL